MANPHPTKLIFLGPTVSFRLSAGDICTLNFAFLVLRYWLDDLIMPAYDPEICQSLKAIAGKLTGLARASGTRTHRVHADCFGIAALMYALRGLRRKRRPMYFPYDWPSDIKQKPLLRQLEKLRKRALRQWLGLGSAQWYHDWHHRWQRFMTLIQKGLAPSRLKIKSSDFNKKVLERVIQNTKSILAETHPEQAYRERDLRKIVRDALHHVRQERALVSVRDLREPTKDGRVFLEQFVMRHLRRLFWKELHALEAADPPEPEVDNDDAFARLMALSRDKARANALIKSWQADNAGAPQPRDRDGHSERGLPSGRSS